MGFFDRYPYTNWHNVNLDWVLERVKEWGQMVEANDQAFKDLEEANASFKEYVTNYLQNLDIQAQIDDKLDRMFKSGELTEYLQPYVSDTVTDWLEEHITEPEGVVIDSSLTVAGAAADAKATGDNIALLREAIRTGSITELARTLILNCFNNVTWANRAGQDYYEALKHEIYGNELIISYSQPQIYDFGTPLNIIRNNLRVSYVNPQGVIVEINDYTMSGELNSERSTITISYNGRESDLYIACAPANRWVNNVLTLNNTNIYNGFINSGYPYHGNEDNRLLYVGVNFDFDNRYRYTISYTSSRNLNIACRAFLKTAITPFANKKNIGAALDTGWQNNNFVYNASGEIGEDRGFCFIPLRRTGNETVSPSDVTNIKITRALR